jgi:hypothetical protein
VPLTLKTYISPDWKQVTVKQGQQTEKVTTGKDDKGTYVIYQAKPNGAAVNLSNVVK